MALHQGFRYFLQDFSEGKRNIIDLLNSYSTPMNFALMKHNNSGNVLNFAGCGNIRIMINIYFYYAHMLIELNFHFFQNGWHQTAGNTPIGIKID